MVGLTVMMIIIASVLPRASAEAQRDKEEELVFRGRQYAEGIRCFKLRYGRYPTSLKEMYEIRPRTLRKLWKDPMSNSMDWGLIGVTAPLTGVPVGPGGSPPGGGGAFTPPTPTPAPSPTPTATFTSPFGSTGPGGTSAPLGPITGVYSKVKKKGYRTYQGREYYNEWQFTEASLYTTLSSVPASTPGPGNPFK